MRDQEKSNLEQARYTTNVRCGSQAVSLPQNTRPAGSGQYQPYKTSCRRGSLTMVCRDCYAMGSVIKNSNVEAGRIRKLKLMVVDPVYGWPSERIFANHK